jgi:hypothetical protein
MKPINRIVFILLLMDTIACHPSIYRFTVGQAPTIGPDDSLLVSWEVKGRATLQIRDYNYPGSGTGPLPDLSLLITQHEMIRAYTLHNDSAIILSLASKDYLVVRKKPDRQVNDIIRYFKLVATKYNKDSSRVIQVAVRPDSVGDELGFPTHLHGDTLVAAGLNNPRRWGNNFYILSVLPDTGRVLEVMHAGITRELPAGGPPDYSFKGTPVTDDWTIRSPLTLAERNQQQPVTTGLILHFILKHH